MAGNYEYPFEVLLPDNIPESVEGLPGGAIIYKMKAIVERTGLVNKNFTCRKVPTPLVAN
jgi:arrestin-related trafficking adapter 4/5/7